MGVAMAKIPGEPSCWFCTRCYEDCEGDLHCNRDGSPIWPGDEVRRAFECGCYQSPADEMRENDGQDPTD